MSETRKIFLDAIEKLSYELEKEKMNNYHISAYCYTKADINNTWNEAIEAVAKIVENTRGGVRISDTVSSILALKR